MASIFNLIYNIRQKNIKNTLENAEHYNELIIKIKINNTKQNPIL